MTDRIRQSGKPDETRLSGDSILPSDDELLEDAFFPDEETASRTTDRSSRSRRSASSAGTARRRKTGRKRSAGRSSSRSSSRGKKRRRSRQDYIHLALLAVILLMFLSAAIRLILWNIGEDSGYDPNADTSEFDTEPQDYIQPMDASLLL